MGAAGKPPPPPVVWLVGFGLVAELWCFGCDCDCVGCVALNGSTNGPPAPAVNVAAVVALSFAMLLLGKLRGGCRTTDGADMVVVDVVVDDRSRCFDKIVTPESTNHARCCCCCGTE